MIERLPSVKKDIRKIPKKMLELIFDAIKKLEQEPFPSGATPIEGYKNHYRIRIGNYRVVYEVGVKIRIITIVRIRHRKDVYRGL